MKNFVAIVRTSSFVEQKPVEPDLKQRKYCHFFFNLLIFATVQKNQGKSVGLVHVKMAAVYQLQLITHQNTETWVFHAKDIFIFIAGSVAKKR